jgi:hypothetical protein
LNQENLIVSGNSVFGIRAVFDPNRETVKLFHPLPAAKQLAAPMKPLCQPAKTS